MFIKFRPHFPSTLLLYTKKSLQINLFISLLLLCIYTEKTKSSSIFLSYQANSNLVGHQEAAGPFDGELINSQSFYHFYAYVLITYWYSRATQLLWGKQFLFWLQLLLIKNRHLWAESSPKQIFLPHWVCSLVCVCLCIQKEKTSVSPCVIDSFLLL